MDSSDDILGDHRWDRTKLIPPMLDLLGDNLKFVKWEYELVPELIWIAELLENTNPHLTARIVENCAEAGQDVVDDADFVLLKDYDQLDETQIDHLVTKIDASTEVELVDQLSSLYRVYPDLPIMRLFDTDEADDFTDEDLQKVAETVNQLSAKYSPFALRVQRIWVRSLAMTGKLRVAEGVDIGDINEIFNYPETEESKRVAATVRSAVNAFQGVMRGSDSSPQSPWATKFWERGFEVSECLYPFELEEESGGIESPEESNTELFESIVTVGLNFEHELKKTLFELWYEAPDDPEFTGKHEVLDGLLMRQVNLCCLMAISPQTWPVDVGGMILRSMTETQITLEWFNQNGAKEDYKQFIEHGLGQRKLILEHQQRLLKSHQPDDFGDLQQGFDEMERSLEAERYKFLIPVDVDSWSDRSTRDLAIEADCKDLYDLRFQQHNPAIHGSWDFIKDNNLVKCKNPLHQNHYIPEFRPLQKIPFGVVEAGNLMIRSLESWVQARGLEDKEFEIPNLPENVRAILSESDEFEGMPGVS